MVSNGLFSCNADLIFEDIYGEMKKMKERRQGWARPFQNSNDGSVFQHGQSKGKQSTIGNVIF